MYKLVLYDTSNFIDFPIGGQLTSIRNFLKYMSEEHPNECDKILLVGVTTNKTEVGKFQEIVIENKKIKFLPVLYRNTDLSKIQTSMRVEYMKALFKFRKMIPSGKEVLHYLHTPEAFIQIKLCHPFAKTAIFSHGSFFNMMAGFRFYRNNKLIEKSFNIFLHWMLKKSNLIFTLDKDSMEQYSKYNKNIVAVNNSIVLPQKIVERDQCHNPIRLLFVGRLSKVKRVDGIIKAVSLMNEKVELTILGDGEEREHIQKIIKENQLGSCVHLIGAVQPAEVQKYMQENDILIMNSILEGKPMTILEAMSYGMPVITTNVGGISEMTQEEENAEYTNGEEEEIVKAVLKIVKKYQNYGKNAFENAKKYDYKLINKNIYENIGKILFENNK